MKFALYFSPCLISLSCIFLEPVYTSWPQNYHKKGDTQSIPIRQIVTFDVLPGTVLTKSNPNPKGKGVQTPTKGNGSQNKGNPHKKGKGTVNWWTKGTKGKGANPHTKGKGVTKGHAQYCPYFKYNISKCLPCKYCCSKNIWVKQSRCNYKLCKYYCYLGKDSSTTKGSGGKGWTTRPVTPVINPSTHTLPPGPPIATTTTDNPFGSNSAQGICENNTPKISNTMLKWFRENLTKISYDIFEQEFENITNAIEGVIHGQHYKAINIAPMAIAYAAGIVMAGAKSDTMHHKFFQYMIDRNRLLEAFYQLRYDEQFHKGIQHRVIVENAGNLTPYFREILRKCFYAEIRDQSLMPTNDQNIKISVSLSFTQDFSLLNSGNPSTRVATHHMIHQINTTYMKYDNVDLIQFNQSQGTVPYKILVIPLKNPDFQFYFIVPDNGPVSLNSSEAVSMLKSVRNHANDKNTIKEKVTVEIPFQTLMTSMTGRDRCPFTYKGLQYFFINVHGKQDDVFDKIDGNEKLIDQFLSRSCTEVMLDQLLASGEVKVHLRDGTGRKKRQNTTPPKTFIVDSDFLFLLENRVSMDALLMGYHRTPFH